jgi:hypothetical protein
MLSQLLSLVKKSCVSYSLYLEKVDGGEWEVRGEKIRSRGKSKDRNRGIVLRSELRNVGVI